MATRQVVVDDSRDVEMLEQLAHARSQLIGQISRRIIGQQKIVDDLVAALLAGGHVLLVGVPGLAKTLLVQTVAQALDLTFSRVQFTPDLMPSDITGTELLEEDHVRRRTPVLQVRQGPDLRKRRARRRDQPRAAEDAGRAPPGDAGTRRYRGRPDSPVTGTVLRSRHAEPDRAGRHVPAARSAARPLHDAAHDRLSEPRRGGEDRRRDDRRPRRRDPPGARRRAAPRSSSTSCGAFPRRRRSSATRSSSRARRAPPPTRRRRW